MYEKLEKILADLRYFTNRINDINKKIILLKEYDLEIFDYIKIEDLCHYMNYIADTHTKEFNLKVKLITHNIFKARFNRNDQISVISTWNNQPYIDLLTVLKFNHILKELK